MEGRRISYDQWQQIEGFLPGRPDSAGVTARDNRLFVGWGSLGVAQRREMEGPAGVVRQVEDGPQALHPRGWGWYLEKGISGVAG